MNWNNLAKEVHRNAVDKGEWDKPRTLDDVICDCLVHLSNAYTAYREGKPKVYHLCRPSGDKLTPCAWDLEQPCPLSTGELACEHRDPEPRGVAVELADCVLRLLNYLATTDADIDGAFEISTQVVMGDDDKNSGIITVALNSAEMLLLVRRINPAIDFDTIRNNGLISVVIYIAVWAAANNIDLESILREKHAYNKTRPYRHGGKEL